MSDPPATRSSVREVEWGVRLTAVAAVVFLVTSIFSGWYALDYTQVAGTTGTTWNETFYPGYSKGHASFAGGPFSPGQFPNRSGFPGPRTLQLYVAVLSLLLGAIAAAILATYFRVRNPRRSVRRTGAAVILAGVGAAIALATPLALIYLEPWAFGQDTGVGPPWASPASSFVGATWGPTVGWYLALIAGALLAGSALLATFHSRTRVEK